MIKKGSFTILLAVLFYNGIAQPKDTLFVNSEDSTYAYAITYLEAEESEQYTRVAVYQFDEQQVAVEMDHKRGKPCGRYKAYYPTGQLMEYAIFGWGYLHGDWTEYNEFGAIIIKGSYSDGKKSGKWVFKLDGIIGNYKNGLKHGQWKYYNGNLIVKRERYKKGVLVSTK